MKKYQRVCFEIFELKPEEKVLTGSMESGGPSIIEDNTGSWSPIF